MKLIKFWNDIDSESPRCFDDDLCTMLSFHSKYKLDDKDANEKIISEIRNAKKYNESLEDKYDFNDIRDLIKVALKLDIIAYYKKLYIYDHSGITISTTPFNCPFDSWHYGYAYVTKEEAKDCYNVKYVSKNIKKQLEEIIDSEIEVFDQYLRNDIYGFTIEDENSRFDGYSCGGFYGTDFNKNGMKEHLDEKYHQYLTKAEIEYN